LDCKYVLFMHKDENRAGRARKLTGKKRKILQF